MGREKKACNLLLHSNYPLLKAVVTLSVSFYIRKCTDDVTVSTHYDIMYNTTVSDFYKLKSIQRNSGYKALFFHTHREPGYKIILISTIARKVSPQTVAEN